METIEKTKNYSSFNLLHTNRNLSNGLINRLIKSINKIGYIPSRPIIVDNDMNIIDGQHRFKACQILNIPIYYSKLTGDINSDDLIIALNSNQEVWRLNEYVLHYCKKGIKFYIELQNFEDVYKLGISNSISICCGQGRAKHIRKGIDLKLNENRHIVAEFIKNCNTLYFYKSSHFVRAIVVFIDKSSDKQRAKLLKNLLSISQQPTTGHYLNVFANIVNRNSSAKIIL